MIKKKKSKVDDIINKLNPLLLCSICEKQFPKPEQYFDEYIMCEKCSIEFRDYCGNNLVSKCMSNTNCDECYDIWKKGRRKINSENVKQVNE